MSEQTTAAPPAPPPPGRPAPSPRASRPGARNTLARLGPWPWIGPCVALILLVVVWPVVEMVITSTHKISGLGIDFGFNGAGRYQKLFADPRLGAVMLWTIVWTVLVVGFTMAISLALAQLYNQQFPGRRFTRWALIVPWAASVIVTSIGFRWMLDEVAGVLNRLMIDLGLISSAQNWTGDAAHSKPWLILVAVFVSLPFTTYTLLAGLQTVPGEVYEAARVDGAGKWQTYWRITLPLLRPSFLVALVINLINVFNSFPVIWGMTQGGPNTDTATSTVFMYVLGQTDVGEAAAMSVVNFAVVIVMVLLFLKVSRWNEEN
ncbi:carbohydrate ABC transporter permease [Kitasatospora viridis]|uniref:Carbohydrate ABC transporter membrane protein 1 (CUT1 family) n=1 Tax=Kitasatospora viridis TaxID=281105 RepID=A0A561SEN8_9ACTN|nr:sugar ABC transporter permease [Kitasatospora viridis]TWF73310.1 carbohydrate ABC transporter membrane protein 1 (CUT1 family) [Kitasatospora viridis]